MAFESVIAVILALVSTILFNIAPILQKEAVDTMEKIEAKNFIKSIFIMFKNKKWLLGTILSVIGGIPYIIALNLGGITIVQPLINFGFIVMVIFANKRLGEKLDIWGKIGIALMIIMPLFIAFGQVTEPIMYTEPSRMYLYTLVVAILALACHGIAKKIKIFWAPVCGLWFSLGALYTQALIKSLDFSGFDVLLESLFGAWISLIGVSVFNFLGMFLGQIGLQKNVASQYNPINQTLNNISAFLGGIIIFSQIIQSPIMYLIGFILGILGVFALAKYNVDDKKELKPQRSIESPKI
jgi:uncharacterized membrane protein